MDRPTRKKDTPSAKAMPEMTWTKFSISLLMGVCSAVVDMVSLAIRPMTVSSPVLMTTPVASPSGTWVPKKARLAVSRTASSVQSGLRFCGSDSPVSEALSTHMLSEHWVRRMSAGMRSPPITFTRSPTTRSRALISFMTTSPDALVRTTLTLGGIMPAKLFMRFSLLAFW